MLTGVGTALDCFLVDDLITPFIFQKTSCATMSMSSRVTAELPAAMASVSEDRDHCPADEGTSEDVQADYEAQKGMHTISVNVFLTSLS